MKPRRSHRLPKSELRKLRRHAESLGIYVTDIALQHKCYASAVSNFYKGDSTSRPLLQTILSMIEEAENKSTSPPLLGQNKNK